MSAPQWKIGDVGERLIVCPEGWVTNAYWAMAPGHPMVQRLARKPLRAVTGGETYGSRRYGTLTTTPIVDGGPIDLGEPAVWHHRKGWTFAGVDLKPPAITRLLPETCRDDERVTLSAARSADPDDGCAVVDADGNPRQGLAVRDRYWHLVTGGLSDCAVYHPGSPSAPFTVTDADGCAVALLMPIRVTT